jgi:flagellar hook-associated protein 2
MSALTTKLGTVSLDGAATGTNTAALVNELVLAASGAKNQVENKITKYEQLSSLYTTLNSKISAIDTALKNIQDEDDFREFSATSTDDDVFTVEADGDAVAGSYAVTVTALAKAQIHNITVEGTTSFSSSSTAIFASGESGSISITVEDGTAETISVDDSTTLTQLASSINDIDGITAYVVQTATEEATGADAFQLFVQADTAGKYEGGDRFTLAYTGLTASTASDTQIQEGTNAVATIAGQTVTSATNSFEAIDGITIKAVSTGTATATVALDSSAMADKVKTFVNAYNSMVSFITANSGFSSSGTNQDSVTIGGFVGESAPRYIQQRMASLISADYGSALSLSSSTQRTALSQLGIKTEKTGLLTFSSSAFVESVEDYQTAVEKIFSDTDGSFNASMRDLIDEVIDSNDGNIPALQNKIDDAVERLETSLDYHNKRLTKYRARLTAQFTRLEALTSSFNSTKSFLTSFFAPKTSNN